MREEKTGEILERMDLDVNDKVTNMVKNLKGRNIPEEEWKRLAKEMLEEAPYNDRLYMYLLEKKGDSRKELQKLAENFGEGEFLNSCKRDILIDIYAHFFTSRLCETT